MKNILFINSCISSDSRTKRLADLYISQLDGNITEVALNELDMAPLNRGMLNHRTELLENKCFDDPMFSLSHQFACADEIVIAAPFWDFSFPAKLKIYLEQITVCGLTFYYGEDGIPHGLCNADKLTYITTAGGKFIPDYGYGSIKVLAQNMFGIKNVDLYFAEMLDVQGFDVEKILKDAEQKILSHTPDIF